MTYAIPMCKHCENFEVGSFCGLDDYCSYECAEAAEQLFEDEQDVGSYSSDEYDGQPSELTEWLDYDPDC